MNETIISVNNIGKCYQIYDSPRDRLKQFVVPKLAKTVSVLMNIFSSKNRVQPQYYKAFWALNEVSFLVAKGETLGIIGRNGSGKSTLLQIICGTLSPTHGEIRTNGRIAALLELGSGFNPDFTGRENVYMNATVLGLSEQQIDKRFDAIASFADIGDFLDQPIKTYSSGMMVRLAFAVIAHIDADILVIDEALAVGDAFFTQKCMRFLREFMKTGSVIFVSHDTASIKSFCTKALWLEKGRVVKIGSPKEVCESYLEATYEAQQGASRIIKGKEVQKQPRLKAKQPSAEKVSGREASKGIQIFSFDPDSAAFGTGDAKISAVRFLNELGDSLSWITGGENVAFSVEVDVECELDAPIIGFYVKDRLGQILFGDNTYEEYKDRQISCPVGSKLVAVFSFEMPLLPPGNYSVTVAVASGSQEEHKQLHWIHDAIIFNSETSRISHGLIGIPMHDVSLEVLDA